MREKNKIRFQKYGIKNPNPIFVTVYNQFTLKNASRFRMFLNRVEAADFIEPSMTALVIDGHWRNYI